MKRIDCRGLACPQPVLETKKALDKAENEEILVLVDNPGAKENVRRFAESQGYLVKVDEDKGTYNLTMQKGKRDFLKGEEEKRSTEPTSFILFIDADTLGRGSEELGKILMRSFLQTLEQFETGPAKIIFLNSGVKLACKGSEVLEDLQEFAQRGVEILSCGTCLDYFGLKKELMVGKVSNMYEILGSLTKAEKLLKI